MKTYSTPPDSNRLSSVLCNYCGTENNRAYLRCDGFQFVRCNSCRLVYQNPRPSEGTVTTRYDTEYFRYERQNEENFFALMNMGLADIGFEAIERDFQGSKKFLDIGCATGMLLAYMKDRGWEEQGVEVCEPSARFGREERHLQILTSTLEEAEFENNSFQVVHCSHLVEHLEDPGSFFREVHRVLQPGGYLILTTPNIGGLQAAMKRGGWRSAIADHLYLFSPNTLKLYLQEYHLEPRRWKTWGGIPKGEAPESIKRIADRLVKALGWGDVMICCARKATAT